MWESSFSGRVYLAMGATDMRKQINTLSILVQETMQLDLFSGSVFVFCNRKRSTVKALYWDRNGFCLWQKRLERERFRWPETPEEVLRISPRELRWLLDGLELVQGEAHRQLQYSSVT
jgi:transposase